MIINNIIDNNDQFVVKNQDAAINFANNSSISYTFWKNKNKMPQWYSLNALDLLYISLSVFAADKLYIRENATDSWSRDLELYIPVLELEEWERVTSTLEKMVCFLSGDKWKFHFRKRKLTNIEESHFNKMQKTKMEIKEYDQVSMLSGGLDSFIGAIDILETNKECKTLFVAHYGGGKGVKNFQNILKGHLIEQYALEERDFHQYYAKIIASVEDTTRTRSFMFFSHAVAVASTLGKPVNLIIPENGLISLNIPSTFSRLGTSSTRTTHPHYLKLFQQLLNELEIPVTFKNPYQFMTKGEMLIGCKNQEFMQNNVANTMSCSHPDYGRMLKETEARHCGYCLPCVIRQAAIKRAGIRDDTSYRDSNFESGKTARMNLNSYKLGFEKFNPKYAFMTIQKSGSITENIEEYIRLYLRGMQEVKEYLEDIV